MMTLITLLYYAFFIAIGSGLFLAARPRDRRSTCCLHSTPLTPGEQRVGALSGGDGRFVVLMAWQMDRGTRFFESRRAERVRRRIRRPAFAVRNYLMPVLTMGLPFSSSCGPCRCSSARSEEPGAGFRAAGRGPSRLRIFLWTWRLRGSICAEQALEVSALRIPLAQSRRHLKVDRGADVQQAARAVRRAFLAQSRVAGVLGSARFS